MSVERITDMAAASTLIGDELVEVSQPSDSVTITATTISAQASDNSFNDSGNGFVTAGFEVDMRVRVTGFTGDVANNILAGRITALTTGKMTIGGADGDVIVNDAAGESVTITQWTSRRLTIDEIVAFVGADSAPLPPVITEAGTSANLDADNVGKYQRWTNAAAKTLTVLPNATEAIPADAEFHIRNVGAGDLTIVEDTGVTINPPNSGTLVVPSGGTVTLKRVAEDVFDLLGQTVAA